MTGTRIEHLDHTGDAGFRITTGSLPSLLSVCAEQMVRLCCPDDAIGRSVARPVTATGADLVELLVNWLTEINGLMSVHRELYGAFVVERLETGQEDESGCSVRGIAQGEPINPTRHRLGQEIKAVTFHEAYVRREGDRWQGQVIFDL